jgi:hypothetical protein
MKVLRQFVIVVNVVIVGELIEHRDLPKELHVYILVQVGISLRNDLLHLQDIS